MSYTYLLEQGAASSAECFSDIPASVLSRLNLTPEKSYFKDSETESCQSSQSGTTCEHLTENRGAEKLMLFAADSRVKTSAAQEKAKDSTASGQDSGKKCYASLAKLDPQSSLLKTHQCLLIGGGFELLESLPPWGIIQDGELSAQKIAVRRIKETDFGFSLPTPLKFDSKLINQWKKETLIASEFGSAKNSMPCWVLANHGKVASAELIQWLMAWPQSWTNLQPLETAKFQSWLRLHGKP